MAVVASASRAKKKRTHKGAFSVLLVIQWVETPNALAVALFSVTELIPLAVSEKYECRKALLLFWITTDVTNTVSHIITNGVSYVNRLM